MSKWLSLTKSCLSGLISAPPLPGAASTRAQLSETLCRHQPLCSRTAPQLEACDMEPYPSCWIALCLLGDGIELTVKIKSNKPGQSLFPPASGVLALPVQHPDWVSITALPPRFRNGYRHETWLLEGSQTKHQSWQHHSAAPYGPGSFGFWTLQVLTTSHLWTPEVHKTWRRKGLVWWCKC